MILALLLAALLPSWEMRVIDRQGLPPEQRALLVAIRKAENGTRLYYGVIDKRCKGYEAQCRWAANTIRLRYDGDLVKFAKRWCPDNWKILHKNVRFFMRKQGFKK